MARLALSLFGPLHVTLAAAPGATLPYDKVRALLAYLAVESDRAHRRETLAELLWPDQPESTARHSLSQALWRLRQSIGDDAAHPPALLMTRRTLQFNQASDHQLDVAVFAGLLDTCDRHAQSHRDSAICPACARRLREALDLYRGSFLEQFSIADSAAFEEWAAIKRELFHQRAIRALDQLMDYDEQQGAYDGACATARRLIALDPWREEAHRRLMRLLAQSGQRGAALAQYERCRRVLDDELGVEPEEETTRLCERIRDGAEQPRRPPPALPASPTAYATPHTTVRTAARGELPLQPTPFVGRERELAWIDDLLADPVCRLLTLAGPGGIGKTRLGIQTATRQGDMGRFADGVCFAPLAGLQSSALLVPAVAEALGLSFYGQEDPKEQLLRALQDRDLLLVLDNFEHLLDGAGLVAEILARSPDIQILVTSRERLNLHGEWVIDVEGLDVPGEDRTAGIESFGAVRLFVQSARRAQSSFALQPEQQQAVARICRLVGGMPLGIELAAAWVPVLSCEEIAREIEQSLDFLAGSVRDLPDRHRSMRAVFDRSWEMLGAYEQRVFADLSVFRGGFTRRAAEQVAEASLPILAALVGKSLLRRNDSGRYEIHELLRQYAQDRLAAAPEEAATVRDRHCDYFTGFLAERQPAMEGDEQAAALQEVSSEIENVRAAWQWATDELRVDVIARAARALWLFCEVTGRYLELGDGFVTTLSRLGAAFAGDNGTGRETGSALAYGRVLSHHGSIFFRLGDYERGDEMIDRSIEVLRLLDAPGDLALALNFKAMYLHARQDYLRERECLEESVAGFTLAHDRWGLAYSLNDLGMAMLFLGDYAEAKRLNQQSLAIFTEIGDKRGMAFALRNLGVVSCRLGDAVQARRYLQESLTIRRAIGHRWGIADALSQLGIVARTDAAYDESLDCFLQALRTLTDLQLTAPALDVLAEIASLLPSRGNREQAVDILTAVRHHAAAGPAIKERAEQVLREIDVDQSPVMSSAYAASAIASQVQGLLSEEPALSRTP